MTPLPPHGKNIRNRDDPPASSIQHPASSIQDPTMDRSIIHLNVADFAVAVERAIDRHLAGRPVIIAPQGAARAAVYDMSEEAYRAGVRKGMALGRAVRLCPDARALPPHPERYEQAMRALLAQTLPYSPHIEAGEADGHLFIDATGTSRLFGPPMDVAWRLRREIRAGLRLAPIWAVAPNKLVAKVATRLVKPEGEYIVVAGEEQAFLAPLNLEVLPGIERDDLLRLREFNLARVRDVAALRLEELQVPFGRRAMFLYETVRGIDASPVLAVGEKPPAVAAGQTFAADTNDGDTLLAVLYRLVEQAGGELRRQRRAAQRVAVSLDYSDGGRCTRQAAARPATANDLTLFETARQALFAAWARRVRVRHLRLACDRLVFPPAQLALFDDDRQRTEKRDHLIGALDAVRQRFGREALQIGRTAGAVRATTRAKAEKMLDAECWTLDESRHYLGGATDDRRPKLRSYPLSSIPYPVSRIVP
jgi:DNA polymerase-4